MNPFRSLVVTLFCLLTGRLRFPRGRVGRTVTLDDGGAWTIFREAVRLPYHPAASYAIFRPTFHLAGMSVAANLRFSALPMLFILGLPGFRSKIWLVNRATGDFQGIYEWDSRADAERYAGSFAMRFMTGRSLPGSVKATICDRAPLPTAGQAWAAGRASAQEAHG
jgi:hypothetical protein